MQGCTSRRQSCATTLSKRSLPGGLQPSLVGPYTINHAHKCQNPNLSPMPLSAHPGNKPPSVHAQCLPVIPLSVRMPATMRRSWSDKDCYAHVSHRQFRFLDAVFGCGVCCVEFALRGRGVCTKSSTTHVERSNTRNTWTVSTSPWYHTMLASNIEIPEVCNLPWKTQWSCTFLAETSEEGGKGGSAFLLIMMFVMFRTRTHDLTVGLPHSNDDSCIGGVVLTVLA